MLACKKPLAMFIEAEPEGGLIPEQDFARHIESGRLVRRDESIVANVGAAPVRIRIVYMAQPDEAWRINAAHAIAVEVLSGRRSATEQDDATLGRLLGYTEEEMEIFLRWQRSAGIRLPEAPSTDR